MSVRHGMPQIAGVAILVLTVTGCRKTDFSGNCADPIYRTAGQCDGGPGPDMQPSSDMGAPEGPSATARLIDDFETQTDSPERAMESCDWLFRGEKCMRPAANDLNYCAGNNFCFPMVKGGSLCTWPVGPERGAFRGKSLLVRFNVAVDDSPDAGMSMDASANDQKPFAGISQRLAGGMTGAVNGVQCQGFSQFFDATPYTHLTFWIAKDDDVEVEVALKSENPPELPVETHPKKQLGMCKNCLCDTYGSRWTKYCIPLQELRPSAMKLVQLERLSELILMFPHLANLGKRTVGEVLIDDIAFEKR